MFLLNTSSRRGNVRSRWFSFDRDDAPFGPVFLFFSQHIGRAFRDGPVAAQFPFQGRAGRPDAIAHLDVAPVGEMIVPGKLAEPGFVAEDGVGLAARRFAPAEEIGMEAEAEKGQHIQGQQVFGQALLVFCQGQDIFDAVAEEMTQGLIGQGLLVIMQDEPLVCQGLVEFHIIRSIAAAEPVEETGEFPGIISPLEDVFQDLHIGDFFIRQPRRRQDFIGPLRVVPVIVRVVAADAGALEELQETDLQFMGVQGIDIVEGLAQMAVVLIRQADDEV